MNSHFPWEGINLLSNNIPNSSCVPQNPAYNCIMEIRYKNLFENKAKAIKPLNIRIQTLNEIKINPKIIHDTILLKTVPWINQSNYN